MLALPLWRSFLQERQNHQRDREFAGKYYLNKTLARGRALDRTGRRFVRMVASSVTVAVASAARLHQNTIHGIQLVGQIGLTQHFANIDFDGARKALSGRVGGPVAEGVLQKNGYPVNHQKCKCKTDGG